MLNWFNRVLKKFLTPYVVGDLHRLERTYQPILDSIRRMSSVETSQLGIRIKLAHYDDHYLDKLNALLAMEQALLMGRAGALMLIQHIEQQTIEFSLRELGEMIAGADAQYKLNCSLMETVRELAEGYIQASEAEALMGLSLETKTSKWVQ